jgi:hypothetical protein
LTKDTNLYNPETETRYSEVLNDVFPDGFEEEVKKASTEEESAGAGKPSNGPPSPVEVTFQTITTFSHMDYTADNFVHVIHVVLVWLVVVFSYFWYMNGVSTPQFLVDESDNFGRRVGFAVFRWTVIMLKLVYVFKLVGTGGIPRSYTSNLSHVSFCVITEWSIPKVYFGAYHRSRLRCSLGIRAVLFSRE